MTLIEKNLRSKVLGCSTNTLGIIMPKDVFLRQTEISNFDVSVVTHKNVLWFQISVENILRVQVMQSQEYIGCIESGGILLESTNLRKIEEKLTTWAIFEHKKELAITLEGIVHLDNKRMSNIFLFENLL